MTPRDAVAPDAGQNGDSPEPADRRLAEMERAFGELLASLPELDLGKLERLAADARSYPANSYPVLLEKLNGDDVCAGALAFLVLRECGDAELKDRLGAAVFDVSLDDRAKVRANELLIELGAPVDADVLEMSVSNAAEIAAGFPSAILRALDAGEQAGAVEALRKLDERARAIVIHTLARRGLAAALPLFDEILGGDETDTRAVASALGQAGDEAAVPVLTRLAESPSREVQKTARRALYAMGGAVEEKPEAQAEAAEAAGEADEERAGTRELPLHKSLSAWAPDRSMAVVAVAREYPNGRLKALITILDFWRRGIFDARFRINMSRAEFRRYLRERFRSEISFEDTPIEECLELVARGLRVARAIGTPIPFDLQSGKDILGDMAAAEAAIANPFLCRECGAELEEEVVAAIKNAAGFDMPVETRCAACCRKGEEGR